MLTRCPSVHQMQSAQSPCLCDHLPQTSRRAPRESYRLRDPPQPHAVRLDAEPLQSHVPRGGARDDAHAQGRILFFLSCWERFIISPRDDRCSVLGPSHGRPSDAACCAARSMPKLPSVRRRTGKCENRVFIVNSTYTLPQLQIRPHLRRRCPSGADRQVRSRGIRFAG